MYVDRASTIMAEVQRVYATYDEYVQCRTCGWCGSMADFAGHVRAKHPRKDGIQVRR